MLISLNWIRDFVDLPRDIDPRAFAEKFTTTTAEVEGIEHVLVDATGLIAAKVLSVEPVGENLFVVVLNDGKKDVSTITHAKGLEPEYRVIYAPQGATVAGTRIETKRIDSALESVGAIVSGLQLGLHSIGERAIELPPNTVPGTAMDMTLFDDWIMEVDNKSITHRPDLWGHYGIAREVAAIYGLPLRPYPLVDVSELQDRKLPEIPIVIDDPPKCPRYSAIRFTGVKPQPAPLWVQLRLAHVGLRPIDILVDLTNYIMAELGQPMHAFDAAGIDRIEVAVAKPDEKFITLDGIERKMPPGALMIQSNRRSIAVAGVMGGAETEISSKTTDLLLESANFEPATIRKCAAALGHRTDASARFEKSLDPKNTVIAIQRFVKLARPELPNMQLTSRLSDAFPNPPAPVTVQMHRVRVSNYIGRPITADEIQQILKPLEFTVKICDPESYLLLIGVPSFRATKDIAIEADIVEEVARFVSYDSIEPVLPTITVRYAQPDAMHTLERQTLDLLCGGMSYAEIHRYIWFDEDWLRVLGYDPGTSIRLRNPAAAGQERLRNTLVPGMLAAVDLNRRHLERFELMEIGSIFSPNKGAAPVSPPYQGGARGGPNGEQRHLGMTIVAPGRKPAQEDELWRRLKTDVETGIMQIFGARVTYEAAQPIYPWEHEIKTATIRLQRAAGFSPRGLTNKQNAEISEDVIGRITVVPATSKRRIDEHLAAWAIAIAELNLSALVDYPRVEKKLVPVPIYPRIDVDFSVLASADRHYTEIEKQLTTYEHPLLRRLAFVDTYEGGSVPVGQRSFLFRATIADPNRTLTEQDTQDFRNNFIQFLAAQGLQLRA